MTDVFFFSYLISSLSFDLDVRQGSTDDVATVPVFRCHHDLLFSLPLLPLTFPCRIVFSMSEELQMWPYYLIFRFFTSQSLGSHHTLLLRPESLSEPPHLSHGLCRNCSEVFDSISSQLVGFVFQVLLLGSSFRKHKEM